MSEQTSKLNGLYIRRGLDAGDPMLMRFVYESQDCILLLDANGKVSLHKVKADNTIGKTVLGNGTYIVSKPEVENGPQLRGSFRTKKGSTFEVAGWLKGEDDDLYFSANVQPKRVRKGFFAIPE